MLSNKKEIIQISVLTRKGNGSPLILAKSLKSQLEEEGLVAEISEEINVLNRLVSYEQNTLSFHFWLWEKLHNYFNDKKILKQLKKADAIVICDCIPNAFWKRLYNIERLKAITKKPVLLYELFSLHNAPTQIEALKRNNDSLFERFDGYLFVSPVTEIREKNMQNSFCIGLAAKTWKLLPLAKKELIALVDFKQPGFENYREIQIKQLNKAGIKFISLEKTYSTEEIRKVYQQVSIFFVQFPEAFGLPILECLCTGAQIFTPDSSWPMSWRLDEDPKVHGPGTLPQCFTVYSGANNLFQNLINFKENFIPTETPLKVFNDFINHYPHFYNGNKEELKKYIEFIKERNN
jgi:hypothetical protein